MKKEDYADRVRQLIEQLFVDGRVRVQGDERPREVEIKNAVDWVVSVEPDLRIHLPGTPPGVDRKCLEWAVDQFYAAAQLAVFRHLGPDEIPLRLKSDIPTNVTRNSSMVYSVDLVFRFLPDLVRIVKGMNSSDPLLERLKEWGRQWPLSSVSIPDLLVTEIEPILADRCLSQLYADRIIESGSTDRLNDPRVREMIRGQFGAYLEMNDKFHKYFGNEREE